MIVEDLKVRIDALHARQLAILSTIENLFNIFNELTSLYPISHSNLRNVSNQKEMNYDDFSSERIDENDGNSLKSEENDDSKMCNSLEISVQRRLEMTLSNFSVRNYKFKRVSSDYYDRSFEERMIQLGAASVQHLCKSIVMVNTQASSDIVDCSNPLNSKYYVLVVQYAAKLNAEKVRNFVYNLNEGKIPKKRFNLRLAPEDISNKLTGFEHNAVTPVGMSTQIPVILSDAIVKLKPDFFWLGGGEVDLKLGINTNEFIRFVKPFITDCTY